MNKNEELKNEITELVNRGKVFIVLMEESKTIHFEIFTNYENWYTKSLYVVKQICPERLEDFINLYKCDKRKTISLDNYVISDALKGIQLTSHDSFSLLISLLNAQINILRSCLEKFDSKIFNIQSVLQADIFDSEIDSAKYLLKNGFLRASGAICGVILEKHLGKVCSEHNIKLIKNPKLANFNDALKDNVYDMLEWRRMQRLADLRNLCDHDKQREPTKEEVEELITGTDRVIKTIF